MSLGRFVQTKTLSYLLKRDIINKEGIRLLDCSYAVGQKPDWKKFKAELYGKFKDILALSSLSKQIYLSGHIPQAIHINLDAAMYPSKFERFTMYSPELFQEYIQLLGINKGEHLIFYGNGALGGMMFPSRFAWLFKSYGHEKVSVLDGGLNKWKHEGLEISNDDVKLEPGNWVASDNAEKYTISYEELEMKEDNKQYIERTDEVNFLDSRPRGQFNGTEETGLDPHRKISFFLLIIFEISREITVTIGVGGSNIPGFKNTPATELLYQDGSVKKENEIVEWLMANGYVEGQSVVTSCNTGVQASFLSYILEGVLPGSTPRLYNGSLKEIEHRDPKKISGGRTHLPH